MQGLPDEEPAAVLEPEPEVDDEPEAGRKKVSKADACREALAEGITETEHASDFARKRYGVGIKPSDFTLYRSKEKRQGAAPARKAPG